MCVYVCVCVYVRVLSYLSCVRLFVDPMDCSLPGSSIQGMLQARTLKWVAGPSSCMCVYICINKTECIYVYTRVCVRVCVRLIRLSHLGLSRWLCCKESACNARDPLQCRRRGFDLWIRKILRRRKWQLISVFLPGKSHGQRSLKSMRLQDLNTT